MASKCIMDDDDGTNTSEIIWSKISQGSSKTWSPAMGNAKQRWRCRSIGQGWAGECGEGILDLDGIFEVRRIGKISQAHRVGRSSP